MPELTKSPEETEERAPGGIEYEQSMIDDMSQRNEKRDELHPYTQSLKLSDIDACVRLEEETFPPQERCTREKVSAFFRSRLATTTAACHCDMLVLHSAARDVSRHLALYRHSCPKWPLR